MSPAQLTSPDQPYSDRDFRLSPVSSKQITRMLYEQTLTKELTHRSRVNVTELPCLFLKGRKRLRKGGRGRDRWEDRGKDGGREEKGGKLLCPVLALCFPHPAIPSLNRLFPLERWTPDRDPVANYLNLLCSVPPLLTQSSASTGGLL